MSPSPDPASPPVRGRPRSFDRDQALDAAMRVFWAKGFAGASIADLTAAMGIASPSLYAAFGSKEALYAEAVQHYEDLFGEAFWGTLAGPGRARDQIEAVLRMSVSAFTSGENPAGCMVVLGCSQTHDLSPELAASLRSRQAGSVDAMEARIRRAMAEGELPAITDARAIAQFYAAVHRGLTVTVRSGADADVLNSVVSSAMAAWEPLTRD
ncbi:TetR/AcrR family transcriptional regulator [Brevundimonas sp.]|uniref:TetR/AcrR family transcriptional regulator n=1 Tax=Brevundimonas sp. TaxID=1871086 RepID=UPI00286BEFBB|nr:TetR/AcrR family transcriptional regulator [Brevundimonas sp.]